MKTIEEMQAEHEALNPLYVGSPVAPLPRYPEKELGYNAKPLEYWTQQQTDAFGDDLLKYLESYDASHHKD
jgi:hypothetical protein